MAEVECKTLSMEERQRRLEDLVKKFSLGQNDYIAKNLNEASLRLQYLNPFLEILGWDVTNEAGNSFDFQDVQVEDEVLQDGGVKHTDYTLYYGTIPYVIIEAKKPSVNIKDNLEPAIQARSYSKSKQVPLTIVTNFQEMAVYDATQKITKKDSACTARIRYWTFKDYPQVFKEIYSIFSFETVKTGKYSDWVKDSQNKRGTTTVDADFLSMIEGWRGIIAKDIAAHNDIEDEYDLTAPVQKLIDRIIFLRIAEGKGIEKYGQLKNCLEAPKGVFPALKLLFCKANEKYDSGLFEKDLGLEGLVLDDKTLKNVIDDLYFPCPYDFCVLPVEILGSVYEQFLGSVIQFQRKTKSGHSLKIEEKPEVAKAGGVFYTPSYIVDYIIEETIGKTIQGKTPEEVASLHFLDPACGSGSFLVGAYSHLLAWHLSYYSKKENLQSALKEGKIYETQQGENKIYRLSLKEKKQILCCNIFGVDIDRQAVEVTRLSLFLKLLEDETAGTGDLFRSSDTTQQKILPSLKDNIKCGNSLVDMRFYEDKDISLFQDATYTQKINAFDWQNEFAGILSTGGFDCIVGNPPYLRVQGLREHHEQEAKFYERCYKVATGRFDFYVLFLEKALNLLKKQGTASFILPHKFLNSGFGVGTRELIAKQKALKFLLHFGSFQVFKKASVYTCIIGLEKGSKDFLYAKIEPILLERDKTKIEYQTLKEDMIETQGEAWSFHSQKDALVLEKMQEQKLTLKDIVEYCSQGTVSMGDDIYMMKGQVKGEEFTGFSDRLQKEVRLEAKIMKPLLKGDDIKRYKKPQNTYWEIYPHRLEEGKTVPLEEKEFKENFPLAFEYLKQFKKELVEKKKRYKTNTKYWYALHCPRNIGMFLESPKIITPEISLGCNMTLDEQGLFHNTQGYSIILKDEYKKDTLAYLAILNSKLMWYFMTHTGTTLRGGYFRFKTKYLEPFPIPSLTGEQSKDLADLAKRLLSFYEMKQNEAVQRQIEVLESRVDTLVCALYGVED